jgi:hypothetical protein
MGWTLAYVSRRRREGAGLDPGGHEHLEDSDRGEADFAGDYGAGKVVERKQTAQKKLELDGPIC